MNFFVRRGFSINFQVLSSDRKIVFFFSVLLKTIIYLRQRRVGKSLKVGRLEMEVVHSTKGRW